MNLLSLSIDVEIYRSYSRQPVAIPRGEYFITDMIAEYLERIYPFHVERRPWEPIRSKVQDGETGKKILLVSNAGIGDTIFVLPTAKYLKGLGNEITLTVPEALMPIIPEDYFTTLVASERLPFDFSMRHDRIVPFESVLDPGHTTDTFHAAAMFAGLPKETELERPGLNDPVYSPSKEWQRVVSFLESKIAVLQFAASSPIKSLPRMKLTEIANRLLREGYRVYVSDKRDNQGAVESFIGGYPAGTEIVNFAAISESVDDLAFLISRADLVVAPDSSAVHLAGCFGVPCVGMYSPFPPGETALMYPTVKPVFVWDSCDLRSAKTGGCYERHGDRCPKAIAQGKDYSPCWDSLGVDRVVSLAREILGKTA